MRYSIIAASLLASTASAWRLPDVDWSGKGIQGWPRTSSSASAAVSVVPTKTATASVSQVATTAIATVVPTSSATATPSTGTGSSGLTSDQQAALDAHNKARAEVGTANLSWDASLAADALAYAQTLASSGTFQHSGVSGQGENLYMQSSGSTPLANAVASFLSEKSLYSGQAISSTNYQSFGHYSKLAPTTHSTLSHTD